MTLDKVIQIKIGDTFISNYQRFSLHQNISDHNDFELVCRTDSIEDIQSDHLGAVSKEFLGKDFILQITTTKGNSFSGDFNFKGIVTAVSLSDQEEYSRGCVIIKGHSASILLEDGDTQASFLDTDLVTILERSISNYDKNTLHINLGSHLKNDTISYSVCSNESTFQYLRRLSATYGVWFFNDGQFLCFGLGDDRREIELSHNKNLISFSLSLTPLPNNTRFMANDYFQNKHHEAITRDNTPYYKEYYTSFLSNKSLQLYPVESRQMLHLLEDGDTKIQTESFVKRHSAASIANQTVASVQSYDHTIRLGDTVKISGKDKFYGVYRVIRIAHAIGNTGNYSNTFEAVSAESMIYPYTNIFEYPKSGTQKAIVTNNNDPKGIGRVQCQFAWQKVTGETTPFIRSVLPYTGTNKGMYFIPEVGEEVLIGFEGNHAEKPFIMGSMYNGEHTPSDWQSDKNNIKAIRSNSGHTITLDDTKGKEEIRIYDKEGSSIIYKTHEKSVSIHTPETLTISAKNIHISAEENISMSANGTITTQAEKNITTITKEEITVQADQSILLSTDNLELKATKEALIQGNTIKSEAETTAELTGKTTTVKGTMTAIVQGASGKQEIR